MIREVVVLRTLDSHKAELRGEVCAKSIDIVLGIGSYIANQREGERSDRSYERCLSWNP